MLQSHMALQPESTRPATNNLRIPAHLCVQRFHLATAMSEASALMWWRSPRMGRYARRFQDARCKDAGMIQLRLAPSCCPVIETWLLWLLLPANDLGALKKCESLWFFLVSGSDKTNMVLFGGPVDFWNTNILQNLTTVFYKKHKWG